MRNLYLVVVLLTTYAVSFVSAEVTIVAIGEYANAPEVNSVSQRVEELEAALRTVKSPVPTIQKMSDDLDGTRFFPSRKNLAAALQRIAALGGNSTLFWFGRAVNLNGKTYLLPNNGVPDDASTLLPIEGVLNQLNSSSAFFYLAISGSFVAPSQQGACIIRHAPGQLPEASPGADLRNAMLAADRLSSAVADGSVSQKELFYYLFLSAPDAFVAKQGKQNIVFGKSLPWREYAHVREQASLLVGAPKELQGFVDKIKQARRDAQKVLDRGRLEAAQKLFNGVLTQMSEFVAQKQAFVSSVEKLKMARRVLREAVNDKFQAERPELMASQVVQLQAAESAFADGRVQDAVGHAETVVNTINKERCSILIQKAATSFYPLTTADLQALGGVPYNAFAKQRKAALAACDEARWQDALTAAENCLSLAGKAKTACVDGLVELAQRFFTPEGINTAQIYLKRAASAAPERKDVQALLRTLLANTRFTQGRVVEVHGIRFIYIPPGVFQMGSPLKETNREDDELLRRVKLSCGFFMAETEVTNDQWSWVMDGAGATSSGNYPKININWGQAEAFCQKLGAASGMSFRLPTEAEWEYACRGATQTPYFNGEFLEAVAAAVYFPTRVLRAPIPVKSLSGSRNHWGLWDMHGNVWEWCLDWYAPYKREATEDPATLVTTSPADMAGRVVRGGSWMDDAQMARSANRWQRPPSTGSDCVGFRPLLEAWSVTETE